MLCQLLNEKKVMIKNALICTALLISIIVPARGFETVAEIVAAGDGDYDCASSTCEHGIKVKKRKVAIFLYEGVEILDFSGPGEVFASTTVSGENPFDVYTVAESHEPILSQGFVTIIPEFSIEDAPLADIIVLPGGNSGPSSRNSDVIAWVQKNSASGIVMSVCTGAFIIGKAGLFEEDMKITTWFGLVDDLQEAYPKSIVVKNTRFIDNGSILTTAGVSAGIDGALQLVSRLLGKDAALETAKYMEYDKWNAEDGLIVEK